jgi:Domain of unknown function (DUF4251)
MKHIKFFCFFIITILSFITFSQSTNAQKDNKDEMKKIAFKTMIDSQHFVFEAQSVAPLRGGLRNLTSPYDVTVTKDSLVSYLPFFGRAYNPPYNSTTPALDFTSTNFSYAVSPHKKSGWDITIKPKDKTDVVQYFFTIYDNGNASLNVTSQSRDAISFSGYIRKKM